MLVIGMNLEVLNKVKESCFITMYNRQHITLINSMENKGIIYLAK